MLRLKQELGSPEALLERYLEAWEEDAITADYSLDDASIQLFKSLDSRILGGGHDRRGLFSKAVEQINEKTVSKLYDDGDLEQ